MLFRSKTSVQPVERQLQSMIRDVLVPRHREDAMRALRNLSGQLNVFRVLPLESELRAADPGVDARVGFRSRRLNEATIGEASGRARGEMSDKRGMEGEVENKEGEVGRMWGREKRRGRREMGKGRISVRVGCQMGSVVLVFFFKQKTAYEIWL